MNLFAEWNSNSPSANTDHPVLFPQAEGQLAVDVIETRDDMIIRSVIAGVKPENLSIHVTSDLVTIRGTRERTRVKHDETVHFEECFWGTFSRSIILPHHVNPDEADAVFSHGVLTLTIPKLRGEMKVEVREEQE